MQLAGALAQLLAKHAHWRTAMLLISSCAISLPSTQSSSHKLAEPLADAIDSVQSAAAAPASQPLHVRELSVLLSDACSGDLEPFSA